MKERREEGKEGFETLRLCTESRWKRARRRRRLPHSSAAAKLTLSKYRHMIAKRVVRIAFRGGAL